MNDWWQILAVIAIAAGAVWLWLRTRRRHNCCDPNDDNCHHRSPRHDCANCPLSPHCRPK